MKEKMQLGGAGAKDVTRADTSHAMKGKAEVVNVVQRPSNFPAAKASEPNGMLSSSPLKMQGMGGK